MTISRDDLGSLGDLATALGFLDSAGDPEPEWLGKPERYLTSMLAEPHQREALLTFVDDALGGGERATDGVGVVWLPLVTLDDPNLEISVTVDERPSDSVAIGLGATFSTTDPATETSVSVPLFQAAKVGNTVTTALLLGQPGARIRAASEIVIDDTDPIPGQGHIGGIAIEVDVPTSPDDSTAPTIGFALTNLQLPGADTAGDLRLSVDDLDSLEDSVLEVVLGLIQDQAAAGGGPALEAAAGLLGFSGDDVAEFPVTGIAADGVAAIAQWLDAVLRSVDSRSQWYQHLAALLGGTATSDGVDFTIGAATISVTVSVEVGPIGQLVLTPAIGLTLGNADQRVEATADLFRVDLTGRTATALPRFGVWAAIGSSSAPVLNETTPTPVRADVARMGFELDEQRRLTAVLAADTVRIGSEDYPTLDLTCPDAVMEAAGAAVDDLVDTLLDGLGDALGIGRLLLGLDPPPGHPTVPTTSLGDLLIDPAGAVGGYWRTLLTSHGPAVTAVLVELRSVVADSGVAASAVLGDGTPANPWRLPLISGSTSAPEASIGTINLIVSVHDSTVAIAVEVPSRVDHLGERCTVVESSLSLVAAEIGLDDGSLVLLPQVEVRMIGRERGVDPHRITIPVGEGETLSAGHVGARVGWRAATGLFIEAEAPNLVLEVDGDEIPVPIPTVDADGQVSLSPEDWEILQQTAGGFAVDGLLGDLLHLLGWSGGSDGPTLALADLVSDPATAIAQWLPQLLISETGLATIPLLADLFAGSDVVAALPAGTGHPDDPYRLAQLDPLPQPALWFPPEGFAPLLTVAPESIRKWRPGDGPIPTSELAAALANEATIDPALAALIRGRNLQAGLDEMIVRWTGGDGRIAPPNHVIDDIDFSSVPLASGLLLNDLVLEVELGVGPTTVVYVDVGADTWLDQPPDRRVDLAAPSLAPEMLPLPTPSTGEWFVALGRRADCRLESGDIDGTLGQAERLKRVLEAFEPLGNDLVVVAVDGAGHAARHAAALAENVADLVLVGTPLEPISLTVLDLQPGADALRLLDRLAPTAPANPYLEDNDLLTGRALIGALLPLAGEIDPGAELRPAVNPPATRSDLNIVAVFGRLSRLQVARAITAIVVSGMAARARARADVAEIADGDPVTGFGAGFFLPIDASPNGSLVVEGHARLQLLAFDLETGLSTSPELRVQLSVRDRLGWLTATPSHELRMVSIDATIGLGTERSGQATVTLHDARVDDLVWEGLRISSAVGSGGTLDPLLPEARELIDIAVQRLAAEVDANPSNTTAVAFVELGEQLGLIVGGGAVPDAWEHLVGEPQELLFAAWAAEPSAVAAAVVDLLGPVAANIDIAAGTVSFVGGDSTLGLFGWQAAVDITIVPQFDQTDPQPTVTFDGSLSFGSINAGSGPGGGWEARFDLAPLEADLIWHRADGSDESWSLWPDPDGSVIANAVVALAPSLAAQAGFEALRLADEAVAPLIDVALDSIGLLDAASGRVKSLFGLIDNPGAWLSHPSVLGHSPAKMQALLDAVRPLLGIDGNPGDPFTFAPGISLAVNTFGSGSRLDFALDSSAFAPPTGVDGRLAAGLVASVLLADGTGPQVEVATHVGVDPSRPDRPALHLQIAPSGTPSMYVRPATGADISLVPFSGFGTLLGAAGAALPFILNRLAAIAGPVGDAVSGVGDALGLRSGTPPLFDGDALINWADSPVNSLEAAVGSIAAHGLTNLASALDSVVPSGVSISADATELTVTAGTVSLGWLPSDGQIHLVGAADSIPGIAQVGFNLTVSDLGLDHLVASIGPASIDVAGVTLQPFAVACVGNVAAGEAGVEVGLAVGPSKRFGARWILDPSSFDLVAGTDLLDGLDTNIDPVEVALCAVEALIDLVAAMAMATPALQDLLDRPLAGTNLRQLFRGVVLEDAADPDELLPGVFDPATLRTRALRLVENITDAGPSVAIDGLSFQLVESSGVLGIQVGLTDRYELVTGETMLWLETDDSWIIDNPPGSGGIFVGVVTTDSGSLVFTPSLEVLGVGLRIGALSGPLLDIGLTLESIAFYAFAAIDSGGIQGGGLQVQFSNLAIAASGASGGNSIAEGILADTGSSPPQPAFSPALAVQRRSGESLSVTMRAGDGAGPWWVGIQQGFGPLYLEQIGFGVSPPSGNIARISVLFDGSVSMFGLHCAVDDLEITYLVSKDDLFNPASWEIDLAGLAVSADMAGLIVSGGLLKSETGTSVEYLGMLLARFSVYGISIYGGYGEGEHNGEKFVSFFAVGALVGPIGGPPAFFLTGIGGGFGINRELVIPSDLSQFGDYPLIKALDTAAEPGNPMEELRALGEHFPMATDTFWFAAGISFTSFLIVNGIAVVAVEIGDGLDINLLGEAQLALPRPEVALVSIELALLARFSSSEGIIWVQGQLTDNSYLLYRDVKLTGGFAFVLWFAGPNRGQFVITIGGYHPDFNRPDYPVVPRLGLEWQVTSDIVIRAGGYFALTSEAVMAGGDFEASADFGPAWAEVAFGAHGIVYFDPFHYKVSAYARIAAGVTVDLWILGEVTFSISIGASIEVEGPDFHGRARFDVGPVELEVPFGSSTRHVDPPLSPSAFIDKYLERGSSGRAISTATITSHGTTPPGSGDPTPDGQSDRPFIVSPEFGLIVTSMVPINILRTENEASTTSETVSPSRALGLAPMGVGSMQPVLAIAWVRNGRKEPFPFDLTKREFGAFPVGIWGPPQDEDNRPLPKGEVIEALTDVALTADAAPSGGGPEIPFHQVEIGQRQPLPFSRRPRQRKRLRDQGRALTELFVQPTTVNEALGAAEQILSSELGSTSIAALRGERQAPPLLGSLGEGLDGFTDTVIPVIGAKIEKVPVDHEVHPPLAIAMMPATGPAALGDPSRAGARRKTTVKKPSSSRPWRRQPPSLAALEADRSRSVAAGLIVVEPPAVARNGTAVATADVPPSDSGRGRPAIVRTAGGDGVADLRAFTDSLRVKRRAVAGRDGAVVGPGDTVVLRLPNARRDTDLERPRPSLALGRGAAPVRVVALGSGGQLLDDQVVDETWTVPFGSDRVVVVGLGDSDDDRPVSATGLYGWHAAAQLPYVGWSSAIGSGCVVRTRGERIARNRQRVGAGWVGGSELASGTTAVTTMFAAPVVSVLLVIDDPDVVEAGRRFVDGGRDLLLGLDGATRARDRDGQVRKPVVIAAENRTVIAYDVIPEPKPPEAGGVGPPAVTVTVATGTDWALVAAMASDDLNADAAAALVTARGLEAAVAPLAQGSTGRSRIEWIVADPPKERKEVRHRTASRGDSQGEEN